MVVLQNGFRVFEDFHGYMKDNIGVFLDWHVYQCFGDWNAFADLPGKGWSYHIDDMCRWGDPEKTLKMAVALTMVISCDGLSKIFNISRVSLSI